MPLLVQFGAGSIGRGFIAQLFCLAGWEVAFVEVAPALLSAGLAAESYQVIEVGPEGETPCLISGFFFVDGGDFGAVADLVARADLLSTAVGLNHLTGLAGVISSGLVRRPEAIDVLVCENGATANSDLRDAILLGLDGRSAPEFGCVRTSIGRMVPLPKPGGSPLDVRVEAYRTLPVDKAAFVGQIPQVAGLVPKDDFTLVLRQKLYLHNLSHAALAYCGIPKGSETVPQALADEELRGLMRDATGEAIEALARAHSVGPDGQERVREESWGILADLERRYSNVNLADTLERVARDPIRKLGADDRLVGAARLCLEQGVEPRAICRVILAACEYQCGPADPCLEVWPGLKAKGWREVLRVTAGLGSREPLIRMLQTSQSEGATTSTDEGGLGRE